MSPVLWSHLEAVDAEAVGACLREWRRQRPDLGVLALASEQEPDAVATLQQAANQLGLPLVGAVVPGLIVGGSYRRHGAVLLALDAATPHVLVPLARGGEQTDDAAVDDLAAFVEAHAGEDDEDTLLLFLDGMTPDVSSLLDRLYLTVDNRVASIDGLPAFEAYRELIARSHGAALTRENFYQHVVHFPLALLLAEGEPLVRIPVAVDDDGSLYCVGEVPEAALLSIVEAAPPGSPETARAVAAGVRAHHPAAVLAFACAGRLLHQGEAAAATEFAELQAALAPAPVFGVLSLGEIANYEGQGYPRFHNATLVALPWR